MGFYESHILPRLIALAMRHRPLAAYRARVVPRARGRVLEIGVGSGLNLAFYGAAAELVYGLDPSAKLLALARRRADRATIPVALLNASAEAIPLDDAAVDSAVMTWTLCSIRDPDRALREIRRVLAPDGALLFVEHGRAPEPAVARWQDRLTPVWRPIAGGCHLNRPIDALIRSAGFDLAELRRGYMPGPRPLTYLYEGRARPKPCPAETR